MRKKAFAVNAIRIFTPLHLSVSWISKSLSLYLKPLFISICLSNTYVARKIARGNKSKRGRKHVEIRSCLYNFLGIEDKINWHVHVFLACLTTVVTFLHSTCSCQTTNLHFWNIRCTSNLTKYTKNIFLKLIAKKHLDMKWSSKNST